MKNTTTTTTTTTTKTVETRPVAYVSLVEMKEKFIELGGSKIITLLLKTVTKLNKKSKVDNSPNPFGTIYKYAVVNGLVGVSYENCVNNQLKREEKTPDFKAMPPNYGSKITKEDGTMNRVIEEHTKKDGKHQEYVSFNPRTYLEIRYADENDNIISKAEIEDFLRPKSKNNRQGTDNTILWIKPKVESIIGYRVDGTEFRIRR